MTIPDFDHIRPGDALPPLEVVPLNRLTLALYCGASGDYNPIHVDVDYALDVAGMDDVIGHGTLTMAYLGRLLTNWVPQHCIRRFKTRFKSPSHVGDRISCSGKVVEVFNEENLLKVELEALNEKGTVLAMGEATISLERGLDAEDTIQESVEGI